MKNLLERLYSVTSSTSTASTGQSSSPSHSPTPPSLPIGSGSPTDGTAPSKTGTDAIMLSPPMYSHHPTLKRPLAFPKLFTQQYKYVISNGHVNNSNAPGGNGRRSGHKNLLRSLSSNTSSARSTGSSGSRRRTTGADQVDGTYLPYGGDSHLYYDNGPLPHSTLPVDPIQMRQYSPIAGSLDSIVSHGSHGSSSGGAAPSSTASSGPSDKSQSLLPMVGSSAAPSSSASSASSTSVIRSGKIPLNVTYDLDEKGFRFVLACMDAIESRGLDDEGLYRVGGVSSEVTQLIREALELNGKEKTDVQSSRMFRDEEECPTKASHGSRLDERSDTSERFSASSSSSLAHSFEEVLHLAAAATGDHHQTTPTSSSPTSSNPESPSTDEVDGIPHRQRNDSAGEAMSSSGPDEDEEEVEPIPPPPKIKTITSALKYYLRNLKESLLTYKLYKSFMDAAKHRNPAKRLAEIHALVHGLPRENFAMLHLLIRHLDKVASHSHTNLMTVFNLGACFGPTLLRPKEDKIADRNLCLTHIKLGNIVVETLIENCDKIFTTLPTSKKFQKKWAKSQASLLGGSGHNGSGQPVPWLMSSTAGLNSTSKSRGLDTSVDSALDLSTDYGIYRPLPGISPFENPLYYSQYCQPLPTTPTTPTLPPHFIGFNQFAAGRHLPPPPPHHMRYSTAYLPLPSPARQPSAQMHHYYSTAAMVMDEPPVRLRGAGKRHYWAGTGRPLSQLVQHPVATLPPHSSSTSSSSVTAILIGRSLSHFMASSNSLASPPLNGNNHTTGPRAMPPTTAQYHPLGGEGGGKYLSRFPAVSCSKLLGGSGWTPFEDRLCHSAKK